MRKLNREQGARLVQIARESITRGLRAPRAERALDAALDTVDEGWLLEQAATFVTLRRAGELHGCMGSIEPRRRLYDDVHYNAAAAAFLDPRALPLSASNLHELRVEVSLLGPLEPITFTSEADALIQLRPRVDGVVLQHGYQRSTFLPQVWESLADPVEFMLHLKLKAGFPPDFWAPDIKLSRYALQKWSDDDLPARPERASGADAWS